MHSPENIGENGSVRAPDASNEQGTAHIVVLGLSHATAPIEVREGIAFTADAARATLARIGASDLAGEAALLSTCNRTELYFTSTTPNRAVAALRVALDAARGVDIMCRPEWTYVHHDLAAAEHLFRVASGLESLLVGEAQIFAQTKQAYDIACDAGQAGIVLNRLFQAALHAGKRTRTETEIGAGAVSVSSAAVGLAGKVFGDLANRSALLVGAGETARLAAEHLAEHGIGRLVVSNRTHDRATALADRFGADVIPFDRRRETLPGADILISATSAPEVLFTRQDIANAIRDRGRRPLLILDLAVPRDIDPQAKRLDDVFLYDVDALRVMVEQNLSRRRKEIPRAEAIVREEVAAFVAWYDALAVTPLIRALREHVEAIRKEQLDRYAHQFPGVEIERLDQFTRTLLNRVMHLPLTRVREFSRDTRWSALRLDTVRELFGLGTSNGDTNDTDRDAR